MTQHSIVLCIMHDIVQATQVYGGKWSRDRNKKDINS